MKIKGDTRIVGLFGYPVTHTLSPLMHNAAFEEMGLNFVYIPFQVKPSQLKVATEAIRALNIRGINVTIPHKERIIDYLDEISEEAKLIGAVNTIVNEEGRLIGYNTDGEGFVKSLYKEGFSLQGKRVFLIGGGGAALAIAVFLIKEKVSYLVIANRTYSRAEKLFRKLKDIAPSSVRLKLLKFEERNSFPKRKDIDLVINATSLGMYEKDSSPVDVESFQASTYIYDIVYNRKTKLLEEAEKRGMKCKGGLDMLIYQGALSFKLWTGKDAPVEKMKEILKNIMKE